MRSQEKLSLKTDSILKHTENNEVLIHLKPGPFTQASGKVDSEMVRESKYGLMA